MAKLTTQAGWVSLGRGALALSGLATAMVLSRALSQADYGAYRQVWLLFYAVAPLLELGLPSSVAYLLPRLDGDGVRTFLIQHGLLLFFTGALLGAGFLTLGDSMEHHFGSPGLARLLQPFALFPAMILPLRLTESALIALGRARLSAWVTAGGALVQSAVILGAVVLGGSLGTTFLLISLWAALRWLAATASLVILARGRELRWSRATLLEQLRFALPVGAATLTGIGARQIDQLIVSVKFPPEAFAIYANAAYDVPLIPVLTFSVTAVLIPAIVRARARGDEAEIRRLWHGAAQRLAWLYFPVFAYLLVAARPLMVLLFSEAYAASAAPFRVFLCLLPLRIALHGAFLRALGSSRSILIASIGSLVVSGGLTLALVQVPALGLVGPALGATLGGAWAAGYAIRASTRAIGWRWTDYFPWRRLGGIMAVSLIALVPAALAGHLAAQRTPLEQLLSTGAAFAICYVAVGQISGAAPPRQWIQAVGDLLRQR